MLLILKLIPCLFQEMDHMALKPFAFILWSHITVHHKITSSTGPPNNILIIQATSSYTYYANPHLPTVILQALLLLLYQLYRPLFSYTYYAGRACIISVLTVLIVRAFLLQHLFHRPSSSYYTYYTDRPLLTLILEAPLLLHLQYWQKTCAFLKNYSVFWIPANESTWWF